MVFFSLIKTFNSFIFIYMKATFYFLWLSCLLFNPSISTKSNFISLPNTSKLIWKIYNLKHDTIQVLY